MKKQELLNYFNDELLEKLYSFCYARTNDSYEAQDICFDIIFALVNTDHIPKGRRFMRLHWKNRRNLSASSFFAASFSA